MSSKFTDPDRRMLSNRLAAAAAKVPEFEHLVEQMDKLVGLVIWPAVGFTLRKDRQTVEQLRAEVRSARLEAHRVRTTVARR